MQIFISNKLYKEGAEKLIWKRILLMNLFHQKIQGRICIASFHAGHYHVESEECGIRIMYEDYDEICEEE